jgi:porphobilinogen synthase
MERLRRLKMKPEMRDMLQETVLRSSSLVAPLFVVHGTNVKNPVASMPGVFQLSIDNLVREARELAEAGIPAVLLFGIPRTKDEQGSEATSPDGIIQQAVRALKDALPQMIVITDVCLCEYTSHGHCGIVEKGVIVNDPTRERLAEMALSHARAGADMAAPSDMMDGTVAAVRSILDSSGFEQLPVMAYAAKFSSALYAPFRDAAQSAPEFGDRKSHQLNPANAREAARALARCKAEGADILMVKPALPYLDILARAREQFLLPLAAYQVSGEYAMIKAAAQLGCVQEQALMLETLLAIQRAGADLIITYFAKEMGKLAAQR